MVQIQIDIDEHSDKQLRIFMAYNNITSKTEGVVALINEYFLIRPPKISYEKPPQTIENLTSREAEKIQSAECGDDGDIKN